MTIKEVAQEITSYNKDLVCTCKPRKHQIVLQYNDETHHLLSPYYQQRLETKEFNEKDLRAIMIEVDRFIQFGH